MHNALDQGQQDDTRRSKRHLQLSLKRRSCDKRLFVSKDFLPSVLRSFCYALLVLVSLVKRGDDIRYSQLKLLISAVARQPSCHGYQVYYFPTSGLPSFFSS